MSPTIEKRSLQGDNKLWCITTFFNFCGSSQRLDNYRAFRQSLGLPLVTVELSLSKQFELRQEDAEILRQVSDADLLWQKERLLNLALGQLPDACEYVAWLDADVRFSDSQWVERSIESLDRADVMQPFRSVRHLEGSSNGRLDEPVTLLRQTGVAAALAGGRTVDSIIGNITDRNSESCAMGYAWVARKSLLQATQFFDCSIAGGGDTANFGGMFGAVDAVGQVHHMNAAQFRCFRNWSNRCEAFRPLRVGFIEGELEHMWHGTMASRQSMERHVRLAALGYDPDSDLRLGTDGCWRWARENAPLREFLAEYFDSREPKDA